MYKHNFVKVGMVVPKIKLGDAYSNALEIVKIIEKELSITSPKKLYQKVL